MNLKKRSKIQEIWYKIISDLVLEVYDKAINDSLHSSSITESWLIREDFKNSISKVDEIVEEIESGIFEEVDTASVADSVGNKLGGASALKDMVKKRLENIRGIFNRQRQNITDRYNKDLKPRLDSLSKTIQDPVKRQEAIGNLKLQMRTRYDKILNALDIRKAQQEENIEKQSERGEA